MPGDLKTENPAIALDMADAYRALVKSANLQEDAAQLKLITRLSALSVALSKKRLASKSSALGWLFGKGSSPKEKIKGLYIWGSVGRGKSMLMDLFFEHAPIPTKRRAHFNDFMDDVHERIHAHRKSFQSGSTNQKDPIVPIARELADAAMLLCFDEFTVTDIADAMILGRLFSELFKNGVVIVATSNVAPENLYKDGLNRAIFLPFIEVLLENCEVFELDARTDYRLEKLGLAPVYLSPLGDKTTRLMNESWQRLTGYEDGERRILSLKGRKLEVPQARGRIARFSFSQLCEEAKGAADFLALAREFHTIFIDNIRIIKPSERNVAKRFILLIDTLYDNRIKLVASAEASPNAIYQSSSGTVAFEFERTVSRLIEMQSLDYLGGERETKPE